MTNLAALVRLRQATREHVLLLEDFLSLAKSPVLLAFARMRSEHVSRISEEMDAVVEHAAGNPEAAADFVNHFVCTFSNLAGSSKEPFFPLAVGVLLAGEPVN